ncbi:MAG: hypothetical protein QOJ06_517 [Pseudonocardiales bacterium]|nr:hypothetical protein [Pseudonocardiales bacterium]
MWARAAEGQNTADNGELPGLSVFWRTDYLDLAPLGRGVDDRDAWPVVCVERGSWKTKSNSTRPARGPLLPTAVPRPRHTD